jgi:predicted RNase H-like nuclease
MVWLCGVEGFKEKWRAVLGDFATGEVRLLDLPVNRILELPERPAIITVDIPIGLPEVILPGGRRCDQLARGLLGPRGRSVFSPIGRVCLKTDNRREASQLSVASGGIGIGAQSWGLRKKLLEIDRLITPDKQAIVYEVHPEAQSLSSPIRQGRGLLLQASKPVKAQ